MRNLDLHFLNMCCAIVKHNSFLGVKCADNILFYIKTIFIATVIYYEYKGIKPPTPL